MNRQLVITIMRAVLLGALALGNSAYATPISINGCTTLGPGDSGKSYRLAQDINVPVSGAGTGPNLGCIEISGDDITLDLGGYRIQDLGLQNYGIWVSGRRTVIRNGSVRGFRTGVNAFEARNTTISHLRISNALNTGIMSGLRAVITDNFVTGIAGSGITANGGGIIADNTVFQVKTAGIACFRRTGDPQDVHGCTIRNNRVRNTGDSGILAGIAESEVTQNYVANAGLFGIELRSDEHGVVIEDNRVRDSGFRGISCDGIPTNCHSAIIRDNLAVRNGGTGIFIGCPSIVTGNVSRSNAGTNIVTSGTGCVTTSVRNVQ